MDAKHSKKHGMSFREFVTWWFARRRKHAEIIGLCKVMEDLGYWEKGGNQLDGGTVRSPGGEFPIGGIDKGALQAVHGRSNIHKTPSVQTQNAGDLPSKIGDLLMRGGFPCLRRRRSQKGLDISQLTLQPWTGPQEEPQQREAAMAADA